MKIFIIRAWIRRGAERKQTLWAAGVLNEQEAAFKARGIPYEMEINRIRQQLGDGWELDEREQVIIT